VNKSIKFSRAVVFVCTLLMTGFTSGIMIYSNFCKNDKPEKIRLSLIVTSVLQLTGWIAIIYFSQPKSQWNLNDTISWGWTFKDYFREASWLIKYFGFNMIVGLLLIFPVWNRCIHYQKNG